ncbi:MAG: hypothetical protein NXI04_14840 [Planctomycetaceae bacterium]|nr:hypothetical protein [Planctomycetaceae bacterium]
MLIDSLFVIATDGQKDLVTSTFSVGPDGEQEAVLIFTSEQRASEYIEAAGWQASETAAQLAPEAVEKWLRHAAADSVTYVAVDPFREIREGQRFVPINELLRHQTPEQLVHHICGASVSTSV